MLLLTGLITKALVKNEIEKGESNSNEFNKNFPFKYYGDELGSFQHVFFHTENLEKSIHESIESSVTSRTPIDSLKAIKIKDTDKDLSSTEERIFIKAESNTTSRGTTVTLILNQSNIGSMQSIQWRVLIGGYIDKDKQFNLISYSPLTFLFWIMPYIRREHDLLSRVRTIYPGSFNDMDVILQVRILHEAVFDAMIRELDKNDIDTSELKVQKLQVMNINISGGKVNMGNVVQGAMNKVTSAVGSAKS